MNFINEEIKPKELIRITRISQKVLMNTKESSVVVCIYEDQEMKY